MRLAASIALAILVSGCASRATLYVYTYPSGGAITEMSGHVFGNAPTKIVYNKDSLRVNVDAQGCFLAQPLEARWVSGAVTSMAPVALCGNGPDYFITLIRDEKTPGFERDIQFAARLSQAEQQQATDAAAQSQAHAAALNAAAATLQAISRPAQPLGSPPNTGVLAFLKRQYISGFNRICIYDQLGSEVAVTISSMELCPQSR